MIRHVFLFIMMALATTPAFSQKGYIPAGHLKLYYETAGHGPAVVLLHGGYLDLHSWDHEAALLARKYRVIRADLPGHGLTKGIDSALLIQDVIRIMLDSLHVRTASFIGLSLGAVCVVDFALAYPGRVNKLVLVSAGLSGWSQVMRLDSLSRRLFAHSDSVFLSRDHQAITENFTHLWCDGPFRKPGDVPKSVRGYVYRTVSVNDLQDDNTWPVFNPDKAAKKVHNINHPVMILAGDKDVPLILEEARYLRRNIRNAQLHLIKGSAHMINLERPALFHKYVASFLSK